jgi:hypothetical protein
VAQKAGLTRAEATRGVAGRLEATVAAYPGLRVATVPAQFLRDPSPPAAGRRLLRGGRLPEAGGEVFDVVADLWRHAGGEVEDTTGLDGRMLLVRDPDGYLITLARHGADDPILTVASPAVPSGFLDRGLVAGLLSGLAAGCLGPCVTTVVPKSIFPALAGVHALFWAWVPLFVLVAGGCLYLPETRRFGAGLLITGALLGITVATVFSV